MISQKLFDRFYDSPEYDGTTRFYGWVREYARPEHRILNYGAGPATRSHKRQFRGDVAEFVGVDIDPIVLENEELDRAALIVEDKVDLPDAYFDLIFSDFVLEHVERPDRFLSEVHRLLRPGGNYFFRTPSLYHYVSIVSALTSQRVHKWVANPARGLSKDAHDPWPTFYRMNTRSRLRRLAADAGFDPPEFRMVECEPSYLQFNTPLFLLGVGYERTVNATSLLEDFRANIFGRLHKPEKSGGAAG